MRDEDGGYVAALLRRAQELEEGKAKFDFVGALRWTLVGIFFALGIVGWIHMREAFVGIL